MLVASAFFLLMLLPHVFSLNFSFTSFQKDDDRISLEKSASLEGTSIALVRQYDDSIGRATYHEPMHLWDKATGKLTDFTTRFTFAIYVPEPTMLSFQLGDGMAFFLAPTDSKLPDDPTVVVGGGMGLTFGGQETMLNSKDHPFVAVEFDTFPNDWDPPYVHVGVDINSIKSVTTAPWKRSATNVPAADNPSGGIPGSLPGNTHNASTITNEVSISYNASTHNLSISFTNGFDSLGKAEWQHLHHIVDLTKYLPERVTFGFSAATGQILLNTWSFYSQFPDIVVPSPTATQSASLRPNPSLSLSQTNRKVIALATGLGVVGGLVLICGVVWFVLWKNKKTMEDDESHDNMSDDFERGTGPRKYSYVELASAANHFKDGQKLGQGGFGGVYRGFLKDLNSYVAIKRISKDSKQGKKEFASEVRIISQLRHRNLVRLIGWCHERKELLLVYEYMPHGSLDSHLFQDERLLTWPYRFKIAQGLASSLLYLHEEWEQCVVHRDIKASNIMLDSDFNAKLGDFGLARLVDHAKGAQTTILAGTMGYMAPECVNTGRASKESDVYSFGVVVLEIACGRQAINTKTPEDEINIVKWVWDLHASGRILEAIDSRLEGDFDHDQIKCLMIVGLWCAHPDQNRRPSIRQAIHVLNFKTPFPSLPSSYPIPTYNEIPALSSFSIVSSTSASEVSQNQNISFSSNTNSSGFTTASEF